MGSADHVILQDARQIAARVGHQLFEHVRYPAPSKAALVEQTGVTARRGPPFDAGGGEGRTRWCQFGSALSNPAIVLLVSPTRPISSAGGSVGSSTNLYGRFFHDLCGRFFHDLFSRPGLLVPRPPGGDGLFRVVSEPRHRRPQM